MSQERVYSESEAHERIARELPGWELREGWLRRSYTTPGFAHTLLLANTIGYIAEAAWHHPDLNLGFAKVTVKLQTHSAHGITDKDFELAKRIEQVALWKPGEGSALDGYPKNWVRPS
jgi:4a-hydroxytetrahydrobiopterin dehydratase